ncbi:BREX system ATP-binding protein BrxD [Proteinivorax hydrogeniformans]|uniref:BREX system ATP-binding protein BrxD n=1 Tax=Proteinivorax hydrogeniformans TaxID=1826727 RepID=A0AAU8HS04_9FIRM
MGNSLVAIIDSLRNGTVPSEGTDKIAVGIDDELNEISNQLNKVEEGGGSFKFIIGDYGSGKTFFSSSVREKAFQRQFVVSSVVISQEAPLHKFEELYSKIMGGMRIGSNKEIPAFSLLLEEWLSNIEEKIIEIADLDPDEDQEKFQQEIGKRIDDELQVVGSIANSFANAIRSFYKAKYAGDSKLAQGAIAWLKGEKVSADIKRQLSVVGNVSRANSFEFFRALLHMIKSAGYQGIVVILDEVETVQKLQTANMRNNAYENLRLFIDETDKGNFNNCFFLYTGTTDLMESEKGFKALDPLDQRLDVKRDNEFKNLRQPVMFLDGFNREKLREVAKKVRDIHGQVNSWSAEEKVSNEFLERFITDMSQGFGGEINISPRSFLRKLVDILDKSEMYEDYVPEEKFVFDDEVRNMVEDTEKSTAHIVNF